MTHKILVVEDEKDIVRLLKFNLEKEGYQVAVAHDGHAGLTTFKKEKPDLVILDLMLPKLDGFDFCRTIRKEHHVPIIILTAKKGEVDRVLGLELGADDYITKPFSVRELLARIKAILRRTAPVEKNTVIRAGTLEIDLEKYDVRVGSQRVTLSTKEFDLLKQLLLAQGKGLTRDDLLQKVWGYEPSLDLDTRTVDQHVARLRKKMGAEADRLITIKNVGYRLKVD